MVNLSTLVGSQFGGVQGTALVDDLSFKGGVASIADGGTITHGVGAAPTRVVVTSSNGLHTVAVTAISTTTITVAIKVATSGAAVSSPEDVYWLAGA